jgi:hypothetical protein
MLLMDVPGVHQHAYSAEVGWEGRSSRRERGGIGNRTRLPPAAPAPGDPDAPPPSPTAKVTLAPPPLRPLRNRPLILPPS